MPKTLSFNKYGLLPKGEYELTFKELRNSILVNNPEIEDWDSAWRGFLVSQAEILVKELWKAGISEIFLDGSFVEAKPHPNDIDGYFVCDLSEFASGHIERELNKLNEHKIWTWNPASRRSYRGFAKKQLPMWHKYRVELYAHYGQPSGIVDRHGNQQMFPAAFRRTRNSDREKGIVKILP